MNNSGILRSVADGESFMPEGEINVTLTMTDKKELCQLEGNATKEYVGEGKYKVTIPSGGWFFAKF